MKTKRILNYPVNNLHIIREEKLGSMGSLFSNESSGLSDQTLKRVSQLSVLEIIN